MQTEEKFIIATSNNTFRRVRCYGTFTAAVGGKQRQFAVTDELNMIGQCLTDVRSRLRVRPLGVGANYLNKLTKLQAESYIARGRLALQSLIGEVGEAKVAKVLDDAPEAVLPKPIRSKAPSTKLRGHYPELDAARAAEGEGE